MALKAVQATLTGDAKEDFTITAPITTDAISTVLAAGGCTILIGDTAAKNTNIVINCLDRLRDALLEDSKDGS